MSEAEDKLLHEIRERYDQAEAEWSAIRDEADKDMRYVAGDPWEEKDKTARENAGRPCLSMDEAGQYLNQVINTTRANPRAMKFAPTGNGANDKGAEFYANKARETEYRSHAQLAYTTAFQNCVERSYGWVRLNTKYENDQSFNQDIWIEDIPNPNMVLPDPLSKRPDSSDLRYLFFRERLPVSEFKRRWPNAKITEFGADTAQLAPAWFSLQTDEITVAEYWAKDLKRSRKLLLLSMGSGSPVEVFEDALTEKPAKERILRSRAVEEYTVTQRITNGVEVLEENPWKGKYIPFASCFGKVIYLEGKRQILSMMRLARDPIMAHAYMETCEAEIVGGVPRNSWIGYTGQFRDPETWQKAAHEPVAFLEAEPFTEATGQSNLLPLPQRQSWDPPIQNIEIAIEGKRRSIQAAIMGSPLPTSAQRHNEKSGVALQQIEKSGQIGSFHFSDHYDDMIRHVGVMFEDLLDKILDAARNTGVREADGTAKTVRVNDPKPTAQQYTNPEQLRVAMEAWKKRLPQGADDAVDTRGDYLVTVSSGPAADSQRDAVTEFVGKLAGVPEIMGRAADLIIRLQGQTMNLGPLIDELAERVTPPEFKKPKEGEAPDPQQLMQALQQGKQENQQLHQMVQTLSMEIKTKQVEAQNKKEIAQYEMQCQKEMRRWELDSKERIADKDRSLKLYVAELNDKGQQSELLATALGDINGQAHEQAHERGMLEAEHAHDMEAATLAHEQALEQAEHGIQGDARLADQAAALQPPPEAEA